MLSQLIDSCSKITVVIVHKELKLLLDRVNSALELGLAVVDFCLLVRVPLELRLVIAILSQFFDSVLKLCKILLELFLAFCDEVAKDLFNRLLALSHQLLLQLGSVESNELLVSEGRSVDSNFIHDFLQRFDTVLVLGHGIICSALGSLEETHLTSVGTKT